MVADYLHKNSQLALIISHLANKDLFCNRYYEVFFIPENVCIAVHLCDHILVMGSTQCNVECVAFSGM